MTTPPAEDASEDAMDLLGRAILCGDAAGAARVLGSHPELRARLDAPLPGAHFGATALIVAVNRRDRETIDVLLRAGADVDARSHWWAGSFGVLDQNDREMAEHLIARGATVDAYAAARHGMIERLREILVRDASQARRPFGDGQTPLHVASSVEVAQLLLDHGADIDALDVDHESTPAQYLVREHPDVARFLVSRGCRTDLLLAAALGDVRLVGEHLEENPAAIRMCVSGEWFPMKDPRAGGHIYTWTLGQQKTAQVVAKQFGHGEVYDFLIGRTPEDMKLSVACEVGDEALYESVLAGNPELIRSLSQAAQSRLPVAAMDENLAAVRLMLKAGWPVDAAGQHGGTALHWACFHGNAGLVEEVLKYRPSLELEDRDHRSTPMGWAVYGSKHGWRARTGDYVRTIRLLLEAGAKAPEFTEDMQASEAVKAFLREVGK